MNIENKIAIKFIEAVKKFYSADIEKEQVNIQKTRKNIEGDYTINVFPFIRLIQKPPEQIATEAGQFLKDNMEEIDGFDVIKGFLNLKVKNSYWLQFINHSWRQGDYGFCKSDKNNKKILIEYSSPNTNKPLHLGHIRNNLLGFSLAKILNANGHKVIKVNLVNDRGIHICKSMLAWQKWGDGETPETSGKKGDKLVGDYYVMFEKEYRRQTDWLIAKGTNKDKAEAEAPIIKEAHDLLVRWENQDKDILLLWKMMNDWVYQGFNATYNKLGIDFDKIYYESDTYKTGKKIVLSALDKEYLTKKEDGSVWADLTGDNLDKKVLLRADGTSVYITQDIGTAVLRHEEFSPDIMIYVVGNEQEYHFQVLRLILKKMGYGWAENILHFSYGMVELPEGKMKSRQGTVVDADDLIDGMEQTARDMAAELGKLDELDEKEKENIYRIIASGALKYFILKVDPKKNMLFNPEESIDFNGNTGPFIQYTYARIQSLLRKAAGHKITIPENMSLSVEINNKEIALIKTLHEYPAIIAESGEKLSPALIANYLFSLAREYNQFYYDYQILREPDKSKQEIRLVLSVFTASVIKSGMNLLGIEVPERM